MCAADARSVGDSEVLVHFTVVSTNVVQFLEPVELVTMCTLTMLGALEVVRTAFCAL